MTTKKPDTTASQPTTPREYPGQAPHAATTDSAVGRPPRAGRTVPPLDPGRFVEAVQRWAAVVAGVMTIDEAAHSELFGQLDVLSGGAATLDQKRMIVVGFQAFPSSREFAAFLARAECMITMLLDTTTAAHWATLGWLEFGGDAGLVRPRQALYLAAACCPLARDAGRFDLAQFDALVRARFTQIELDAMRDETGGARALH